jgi:hypothetical protein
MKRGKMTLNMQYFETLREKINLRLKELVRDGKFDRNKARAQIEQYPWLYGALGKIPSEVMFICENPSLKGVEKADEDTIDKGRPDIEAQWWGGSTDNAACRFRVALCKLKLKTTRPRERDGWECYITNVIKQANTAKDQEKLSKDEKRQQARDWADILQWEFEHVKPKYVICVGGNAYGFVQMLQRERRLIQFPVYEVMHYSARGNTQKIIDEIVSGVRDVMTKS